MSKSFAVDDFLDILRICSINYHHIPMYLLCIRNILHQFPKISTHTYIYIYVYICIHVCTYLYVYTQLCTYTCVCIYTHTYIYIYKLVKRYIYIFMSGNIEYYYYKHNGYNFSSNK